jgi:glutathione peroxidase
MKLVIIIFAVALVAALGVSLLFLRGALATGSQAPTKATEGSLWGMTTNSLEGKPVDLSIYKGKVALVVNVASKCGLTPQYEGLQVLYEEMAKDGLVVLAFPSNDFMGQEPGTPEEIRSFCDTNYQVTFPMFAKVKVKGGDKSEIFAFLTAGGLDEPTWNFTKYLVGRDGKVIARFAPRTKPDDPALVEAVRNALK